MKKILIVLFLIGITAFIGIYVFSARNYSEPTPQATQKPIETSKPKEVSANKMDKPEMILEKGKDYKATLQTSEGEIVVNLFEDKTPITVNNFVYLANKNFYDNTIFHRVIKGFMIQGGDPEGTGAGGPGYRFDDEPFDGEYVRGTLAMANAGANTNGSQFFIMHADYNLPKNYVIFGKVESGLDVVDAIATAETEMSPSGEMSKPVNPVVVESIEIEAN